MNASDAVAVGTLPTIATMMLPTGDPYAVAAWIGTMIGSAVAQYVIATRRRRKRARSTDETTADKP